MCLYSRFEVWVKEEGCVGPRQPTSDLEANEYGSTYRILIYGGFVKDIVLSILIAA